ncbi:hypothetical protein ACWEO1_08265 [Kitasatospora cineracea]|uniref:hypothetical protein n=1 Tax=Kitasatospora sp. NRRL B-11411 TaxID=1463822 RepID=UPI0004C31FA6|nr:hypothetical protein [Kitasatospora sp. NRRL B-11411]
MTANSTTDEHLSTGLMTLLRDQGLLHTAEGASDGSWIVRRTRSGPQFVLETPPDAIEYAVELLVDYQLETSGAR